MIAAAKPLSLTKATLAVRPSMAIRRRAQVVRASEGTPAPEETSAAPAPAVVEAASVPKAAAPAPAAPAAAPQGFGDLMAFSGPAPELINGRLAMLAIVAAIGAELSTGESVLTQFNAAPVSITLTAIVFTIASLIPQFQGAKREAFAFFSPAAEMANGRAAMLGFAALLVVEGFHHAALF